MTVTDWLNILRPADETQENSARNLSVLSANGDSNSTATRRWEVILLEIARFPENGKDFSLRSK
jgi:hypothetical protein